MAPEDKAETVVITPFGLYEFNVMPFGLTNAAQFFQRFMDMVLRGLEFCFCYIDDILIASRSPEEHQRHLELVLSRLKEYGLTIKISKCHFSEVNVNYLDHVVTPDRIKPLNHRVKTILDFPKPTNVSELRRFSE